MSLNTSIAIIVSGLNNGGVERLLLNYLDEEILSEYRFIILYQHEADANILHQFEERNIKCFKVISKEKNIFKHCIETYKLLRKNKIDIVHAHLTTMNFVPLSIAYFCRIKYRISHSHNSMIVYNKRIYHNLNWFFKLLTNIFATNRLACGKEAGLYLYGQRKFQIFYNSIDLTKFKFNEKKRNLIRERYGISENTYLLGNVGRFTKQKNQEFLIHILNRLDDRYKMMIIGDGPLKESLMELAISLKCSNRVIFIEPNNYIDYFYSSFDAFLLPSLWEGLPFVLIEAQVCGLKCICSDNIDHSISIGNLAFENIKSLGAWIADLEYCDKDYTREVDLQDFIDYDLDQTRKNLLNYYRNLEKQ